MVLPGDDLWAIEIECSLAPKPGRGFYQACEDLAPAHGLVAYPGEGSHPIAGGVEVLDVRELCDRLVGAAAGS